MKKIEVAKYIYDDSKERTMNFRNEVCKKLDDRSRAEIELEKDYLKFTNIMKNIKNIPDVGYLLYDKLNLQDVGEYEDRGRFNECVWNSIEKFKLGALGIAAASNLEVDVEEDRLIYNGENLSAEFLGRGLLPKDIDFDGIDIDNLDYNNTFSFIKTSKNKKIKENQVYDESLAYERKNYEIRERLKELNGLVDKYMGIFNRLKEIYFESLSKIEHVVSEFQVDDYNNLTEDEKENFKSLLNSVAISSRIFDIPLLVDVEKIELNPDANNELDEIEKFISDLEELLSFERDIKKTVGSIIDKAIAEGNEEILDNMRALGKLESTFRDSQIVREKAVADMEKIIEDLEETIKNFEAKMNEKTNKI